MMADARTWWQVAPALADRGYLALAVDLPGVASLLATQGSVVCRDVGFIRG